MAERAAFVTCLNLKRYLFTLAFRKNLQNSETVISAFRIDEKDSTPQICHLRLFGAKALQGSTKT